MSKPKYTVDEYKSIKIYKKTLQTMYFDFTMYLAKEKHGERSTSRREKQEKCGFFSESEPETDDSTDSCQSVDFHRDSLSDGEKDSEGRDCCIIYINNVPQSRHDMYDFHTHPNGLEPYPSGEDFATRTRFSLLMTTLGLWVISNVYTMSEKKSNEGYKSRFFGKSFNEVYERTFKIPCHTIMRRKNTVFNQYLVGDTLKHILQDVKAIEKEFTAVCNQFTHETGGKVFVHFYNIISLLDLKKIKLKRHKSGEWYISNWGNVGNVSSTNAEKIIKTINKEMNTRKQMLIA